MDGLLTPLALMLLIVFVVSALLYAEGSRGKRASGTHNWLDLGDD